MILLKKGKGLKKTAPSGSNTDTGAGVVVAGTSVRPGKIPFTFFDLLHQRIGFQSRFANLQF